MGRRKDRLKEDPRTDDVWDGTDRTVAARSSAALHPAAKTPWLHTFPARVVYFLLYVPAIYSCGQTLQGIRQLLAPDPARGPQPALLEVCGWGLAFLAGFGSLALFWYEDSRWRGRLGRRIRLFEALLRLGTPGETSDGTPKTRPPI